MANKENLITVLFIACTHGNEQVGKWLWNAHPQGFNETYRWQVIIGNPKAVIDGVRFTDEDLNRAYNRASNPNSYERERAIELTPLINSYDIVYDIHQTTSHTNMQDCIFINENTPNVWEAIRPTNAKYIVIDNNPEYSNHFATSVAKTGITLEYYRRGDYQKDAKALEADFLNIIAGKKQKKKRTILETYIALPYEERFTSLVLKNFQPLTAKQKKVIGLSATDEFLPFFVNSYPKAYCFINRIVKEMML